MATPTTNPLGYLGVDSPNPRNDYIRQRAPTTHDFSPYQIGDRWIDTIGGAAYTLVQKVNNLATWV